jgi:methyltransferase (TIGR00027 family)
MEAAPSRTAMLAALARALFRLNEAPPWPLDDPLALALIGPTWPELKRLTDETFAVPVQRQVFAGIVGRARYAEDRLEAGSFTQYVMLGAGLDSFIWRRPDLASRFAVYEVDHPVSQAWKQEQIAALALPVGATHVFVPIDFEVESLEDGLGLAGFDWTQPTMFSWIAVTPYLTSDAIESTLRTLAGSAAGSEVVLTYRAEDAVVDEVGHEFLDAFRSMAAASGEPITEGWSRIDMEELVTRCGLIVSDHPTRAELVQRYFADRADGLMPYTVETLLTATVA